MSNEQLLQNLQKCKLYVNKLKKYTNGFVDLMGGSDKYNVTINSSKSDIDDIQKKIVGVQTAINDMEKKLGEFV